MPKNVNYFGSVSCLYGRFKNLSFLLLAILYLFFSVRYPVWNFDDISFVNKFLYKDWGTLKQIFLGIDLPTEYRTYSFSRCLQFVLLKVFGDQPLPFYFIMAVTHLATAFLIYKILVQLSSYGANFESEALGCAFIWIFSPFSICRTFHHFSYILFPFFLLLLYIFLVEKGFNGANTSCKKYFSGGLLFVLCLSGEAILPALICYLLIKIYQQRDAKFAGLSLLAIFATLLVHYTLLNSFNDYSARRVMRFSAGSTDYSAVLLSLSYFGHSIVSALAQGFQLTAISYEPYYASLKSYSFAWSEASQGFIYASIALSTLILIATMPQKSATSISSPASLNRQINNKILVAIVTIVLSLWSLYFAMSLAGSSLYGRPFSLQIRYGYVVLPVTFIAISLLWRRLPPFLGLNLFRPIPLVIPIVISLCWLAYQMNVAPLNAVQDRKITATLNDAFNDGVRVISIEQDGFKHDDVFFNKYPQFGITNPFIRWGDSPFQQNWTVSEYLRHFGLRLESRTYIDWNSENVLFWSIGSQPTLVNKSQVMLIGSKSLAQEPKNFPRNDLYAERIRPGDHVVKNRVELLISPVKFENGLELIRLTKIGLNPNLIFIWSGKESNDQVFVHLLGKDGKMISQGDYVYQNTAELPEGSYSANNNRIYVLPVQREIWDRVTTVALGVYQVATPSQPQVFRKTLNGLSDWEGHRLLMKYK